MTEWVIKAFENMRPDINELYAGANGYNLADWKLLQQSLVTASGAAAVAIPGLHLLGMAADVAFLMNRMGVCAYGMERSSGRKTAAATSSKRRISPLCSPHGRARAV